MFYSLMVKSRVVFPIITFLAVVFQSAGPAAAELQDICIPPIGGLVSEPKMDGQPQDDIGWNGAGQLGIRDVTAGPNGPAISNVRSGSIQYGVRNNFLYFSVDMDNGSFTDPGPKDRVVVALSPDGSGADSPNAWRIHISPGLYSATPGIVISARPPDHVAFWRDSSTWNTEIPGGKTCTRSEYWQCDTPLTMDNQGIVTPSGTGTCNPLETAQFVVARNGSRWGLEAKIPYSTNNVDAAANCKIYIPAANTFKFYINVVSTNDLLTNPDYIEDPWPFSVYLEPNNGLDGVIESSTPAPTKWGNASLDTTRPACTGIKIIAAGVKPTLNSPLGTTSYAVPGAGVDLADNKYYYLKDPNDPNSIKLKDPYACNNNLANGDQWPATVSQKNTFVARAINTGLDTPNVSAKFYIAPWGLPGPQDWDLIGERYRPTMSTGAGSDRPPLNPTTPPEPIGANSVDLTTDWQLSYKESCAYALSNVSGYYMNKPIGHHCVQAELTSSDLNANFITKSLQFNHDVAPASRIEQNMVIGTRGYGKPAQGKTYHEILLSVDQIARKYGRDGNFYYPRSTQSTSPAFKNFGAISAERFPNGMTEALAVVWRGYLLTDYRMKIDKITYQRAKYIGATTLEAGHNGPVDNWGLTMEAKCPPNSPKEGCVSSLGRNRVVRISQDSALRLTSTVEAVEPTPCKPTPCSPCPKTAGSTLVFGMVGIGCAAGFKKNPRRRKEGKDQEREK